MARVLDRSLIRDVIHAMGERLEGDWLLIGGAAIASWLEPRRVTEDIDVVSMDASADARFALMELAEELGLPIETVNSAADFFVRRVEGWRDHVEVLHRGSRSTIYRPDATLMLQLKLRRLSERDLQDCELVVAGGEAFDPDQVLDALASLPPAEDPALIARRAQLRALLRL